MSTVNEEVGTGHETASFTEKEQDRASILVRSR